MIQFSCVQPKGSLRQVYWNFSFSSSYFKRQIELLLSVYYYSYTSSRIVGEKRKHRIQREYCLKNESFPVQRRKNIDFFTEFSPFFQVFSLAKVLGFFHWIGPFFFKEFFCKTFVLFPNKTAWQMFFFLCWIEKKWKEENFATNFGFFVHEKSSRSLSVLRCKFTLTNQT